MIHTPMTSHSSNDMRLASARLLPSLTTILEVITKTKVTF